MPKVSVIIPTYNRPDLIGPAIQSVLDQTYKDFELIVVDDGVEERAEKVVKSFYDERIRYIQNEMSCGGGAARNTGIKKAKGEFIAFLDDDDQWVPEKLEIQMEEFERTGEDVGFCFSAVTQKRDDGNKVSIVYNGEIEYYETALKNVKGVLTSALIVKREALNVVGCLDENFPSHQEAELVIRLSKRYKGFGINKSLVSMIVYSNHVSIGKNLKNRIKGREMMIKKHFKEYQKRPKILVFHYFQLGLFYRDFGETRKAKKYFIEALKIAPLNILYWKHLLYIVYKLTIRI